MAIIGAAVAALGIIIGLALVFTAGSTREETIKSFARAPVGCTTTLQFDRTGTFTFYVETRGSVPNLGGDCAGSGGSYQHVGEAPSVRLTLVDAAGTAVALEGEGDPSYDEGAYAGDAHVTADITTPGSYQLTVESAATDIAIAVGGDPDADASSQTTLGIAIAVIGALLGGLLLVLGKRKKATPPSAPAAAQWPTGPSVPGWQQAAPAQAPAPQQPSYPPQQAAPVQPQYAPQPAPQSPAPQYPPQAAQPPQAPTAAPPPAGPWGTPPQQ